ncbi:energy transducer TonB [Undibacterium sp. JH2W]|uniref:cell envelope integrity protein TolA n=1 Tax=Undibacterium sp. JH2W TaxID=3413037 RepID=UPI003BF3A40F
MLCAKIRDRDELWGKKPIAVYNFSCYNINAHFLSLTWSTIPEPSHANKVLRTMNQVSNQAHPDFHQHQTGRLRAIVLAALVHIVLLSFLWVGVSWQNKASNETEAELWDMTTREAAPKPVPVPEPVVEEKPKEPVPVKEEVRQEDPEIALAQEKKRKLLEKKKEEEHQRELAEKKRKEEQQEKLAEQKRKEEKLALDAAEKKKLLAKDKKKSDDLYKEELTRVANQAAKVGSGGAGVSEKSTGNNRGDPSYIAKIAAKVRSNTVFGGIDSTAGNPTVEYSINLLPDGSLRGAIRKVKSSGIASFDDAVAAGIEKSAPFPRDKTGQVPTSLTLVYRMKEE